MRGTKKLDALGCKTFVCPNLKIMESRCNEHNIRKDIIERAKSMASEYFRKTYHMPRFASARHVIPAIVYIACTLEGEKRSKVNISKMFGVSYITVRKWQIDVMKVLNMETLEKQSLIEKKVDVDSQFCEIDKEGKALLLKDSTIETAKYLMSKYFKIENFGRHYSHIKRLRSAFIYSASIIENDKRTQMEICKISGSSEANISYWYHDVIRVLGIKVIAHDGHTVKVLEGQYDS